MGNPFGYEGKRAVVTGAATGVGAAGVAAAYVNGVNLHVDAGFAAAMTTGQVDFSGLA